MAAVRKIAGRELEAGLPRLAVGMREAASALGISVDGLYRGAKAGRLKTIVVAGRRLIPASELNRILCEGLELPPRGRPRKVKCATSDDPRAASAAAVGTNGGSAARAGQDD
jgi:hypothetical protein